MLLRFLSKFQVFRKITIVHSDESLALDYRPQVPIGNNHNTNANEHFNTVMNAFVTSCPIVITVRVYLLVSRYYSSKQSCNVYSCLFGAATSLLLLYLFTLCSVFFTHVKSKIGAAPNKQ